MLVHRFICSET